MTAGERVEVRFAQLQFDAWSGRRGRWVVPPGWHPAPEQETVQAEWFRDGVTWRLEGPWGRVRSTLVRLGLWVERPQEGP